MTDPKSKLNSILNRVYLSGAVMGTKLKVGPIESDKVIGEDEARLALIELMEGMVPEIMNNAVRDYQTGYNSCRKTMLDRIKELK